MTTRLRSLTEDFQRMGLSENAVEESMFNLIGEDHEDDAEFDEEFDEEDEDALSIVEAYKRRKKLTGKKKIQAKKYRKSASGKRSAKKQAMQRKRPGVKKIAAKRRKKLSKLGGAKKGFIRQLPASTEWEGTGLSESLMENIQTLAEAVDRDEGGRFDEYVEAFNHIADLGELLTINYHGIDEEELAEEAADLAIAAEEMLEGMEDLDGVVSLEDDAMLEANLHVAMELVSAELENFTELHEEFEMDYEDELDEDFDDDDFDDDDEDSLIEGARRAARAAKKGGKKAKKKKFKGKVSKSGKSKTIAPGGTMAKLYARKGKSVRDPEAVGAFIARHGSYNKKTGKTKHH